MWAYLEQNTLDTNSIPFIHDVKYYTWQIHFPEHLTKKAGKIVNISTIFKEILTCCICQLTA